MKKTTKQHGSLYTFILSLVFAIAIWVVVGIVNDPDIRNTVTSLPIHYAGTGELAEKGLVIIAPEEKATAAVTVSGKRRDLIKYSDELYISVDVSGISSPGEYSMKGVAQLANDRISIVRERLGEIDIVAEKRDEKEIDVEIKQTGSSKSNIIKAVPHSEKIKVSGAQSEIAALSKAVISLDISKIEESSTIYSAFKLCDENGAALTKALTLSPETESMAVDLTVYEKKSLPVTLRLNEELSEKYRIDEEKSIIGTATVDVGVMSGYNAECVYADIDSTSGESDEFSLIEEEGMYIPEDRKTITAKPHIISVVSRHMDVTVRAENLGEGLSADFADTLTGVLLNAPEEILSSEDFQLIIDLAGLEKGEHRVKVKASDDSIRIAEEIFVDVIIH